MFCWCEWGISHMQKQAIFLVFLYVFFDTMLKNGPIVNYCSQRNNGSLLRFSVRVQNWDLVEVNIPLPWICSDVVSCTYAYEQVRRFLYQHPLTKIGLKEEQNPNSNSQEQSQPKWNRGPRFLKCFKIQWGDPFTPLNNSSWSFILSKHVTSAGDRALCFDSKWTLEFDMYFSTISSGNRFN